MIEVPLESILECFQGVFPSPIATCAADGMPNITYMSLVHYVDGDRVALSRQYFRKTAANLEDNPVAQVLLIHPATMVQYLLDLEFLHTETASALFETVRVQLEAIAAHTGVAETARLRGVDIFRVQSCRPVRPTTAVPLPGRDLMQPLDDLVARVAAAADRDEAVHEIRASLADLFGISHSVVLIVEDGELRPIPDVADDRLEVHRDALDVHSDAGVIGVAAQRRQIVSVPNVPRAGVMGSAVAQRQHHSEHRTPTRLLGAARMRSLAAVPLAVGEELVGVLYLESEQPGFFNVRIERLLRILGRLLAAALVAVEASSARGGTDTAGDLDAPLEVTYYHADDSVFVGGQYVIKGAPGRILWKLIREHVASGRIEFTNRELRLDEQLQLPPGNANLDSRLIALRRKLADGSWGIGLERVGRGQLALRVERSLVLAEIATEGPMRREPTLPAPDPSDNDSAS